MFSNEKKNKPLGKIKGLGRTALDHMDEDMVNFEKEDDRTVTENSDE